MAKKTKCSPNMTYLLCLIIVGLIIYLIYTNLNFGNENNKRRESFQNNNFPPVNLTTELYIAKRNIETLGESLGRINNMLVDSVDRDDLAKIYQPVIDKKDKLKPYLLGQINKLSQIYSSGNKKFTGASKVTANQQKCLNDEVIKAVYDNAAPYYCMSAHKADIEAKDAADKRKELKKAVGTLNDS